MMLEISCSLNLAHYLLLRYLPARIILVQSALRPLSQHNLYPIDKLLLTTFYCKIKCSFARMISKVTSSNSKDINIPSLNIKTILLLGTLSNIYKMLKQVRPPSSKQGLPSFMHGSSQSNELYKILRL